MFNTRSWIAGPLPPFLATPRRIVGHFLPLGRPWLRTIGLLVTGASLLNAAAYLALQPLLDYLTGSQTGIVVGTFSPDPGPGLLLGVVGLVVLLLAAALQLKYRAHAGALTIFRDTVRAAATEGLLALRRLPPPDGRPEPRMHRAAQTVTGPVAFACGFAMKQFALGVADAIQLVVFTAILMWLSPWLTLAFLATVAGIGAFYMRSLQRVATHAGERAALTREARAELRELSADITDPTCSDDDLRQRLSGLYAHGAFGRQLAGRVDVRAELKRGPLLIEYLFPVALVVLPVVALATGSFRAIAGNLIVYLLLLRQTIASLQGLAALLISVGRYQPQLACFDDLQSGNDAAGCRLLRQDGKDAESDDDAD
jgi:hypothetical protein